MNVAQRYAFDGMAREPRNRNAGFFFSRIRLAGVVRSGLGNRRYPGADVVEKHIPKYSDGAVLISFPRDGAHNPVRHAQGYRTGYVFHDQIVEGDVPHLGAFVHLELDAASEGVVV